MRHFSTVLIFAFTLVSAVSALSTATLAQKKEVADVVQTKYERFGSRKGVVLKKVILDIGRVSVRFGSPVSIEVGYIEDFAFGQISVGLTFAKKHKYGDRTDTLDLDEAISLQKAIPNINRDYKGLAKSRLLEYHEVYNNATSGFKYGFYISARGSSYFLRLSSLSDGTEFFSTDNEMNSAISRAVKKMKSYGGQ